MSYCPGDKEEKTGAASKFSDKLTIGVDDVIRTEHCVEPHPVATEACTLASVS